MLIEGLREGHWYDPEQISYIMPTKDTAGQWKVHVVFGPQDSIWVVYDNGEAAIKAADELRSRITEAVDGPGLEYVEWAARQLWDNRLGFREDAASWHAPQSFWVKLGEALKGTQHYE